MIPHLQPDVLQPGEITRIHGAMVRILSHTGLVVENGELWDLLAEHGAEASTSDYRVRFTEPLIERFLAESDRVDYLDTRPAIRGQAGVYQGWYLDPESDELRPFTESSLVGYIRLAHRLEHVTGIHMQNLPLAAARATEPLELKIFAWRHGAHPVGSIQLTALCPYLEELYQIKADADGRPLAETFQGSAFMISPLRIPAHEAEQVMYFRARGLPVRMSNMITAGGTGPVTLAGCVALNLAECVALGFVHRALFGDRHWHLGGSISPLDMRTLIQPYGRPEMLLANLANLQLARHYQVSGGVHAGLTDAKRPSHEAAAQKLLTALPCALAGNANLEPGLLSIDEVFSPVQMVLDNEVLGAIGQVMRGFAVDEESLAVDLIDEVGPGGLFTDREHTARHFRRSQWEPTVWSREMVQGWLAGDGKIDAERAVDRWRDLMAQPEPEPGITPELEVRLWDVVRRAERALR
jgi:trimethylamine--corrinoid protein Co-methyltransferase